MMGLETHLYPAIGKLASIASPSGSNKLKLLRVPGLPERNNPAGASTTTHPVSDESSKQTPGATHEGGLQSDSYHQTLHCPHPVLSQPHRQKATVMATSPPAPHPATQRTSAATPR